MAELFDSCLLLLILVLVAAARLLAGWVERTSAA
jgi:hypothetical protein